MTKHKADCPLTKTHAYTFQTMSGETKNVIINTRTYPIGRTRKTVISGMLIDGENLAGPGTHSADFAVVTDAIRNRFFKKVIRGAK